MDFVNPTQAVQAYPELAGVAALRDAGWRFMPLRRDDMLAGLVGFRPAGRYAVDALYVFDRHDCRAVRLVGDAPGARGGVVWEYHGPLAAAIHELRGLPAPGNPRAPRLVIRQGPALP